MQVVVFIDGLVWYQGNDDFWYEFDEVLYFEDVQFFQLGWVDVFVVLVLVFVGFFDGLVFFGGECLDFVFWGGVIVGEQYIVDVGCYLCVVEGDEQFVYCVGVEGVVYFWLVESDLDCIDFFGMVIGDIGEVEFFYGVLGIGVEEFGNYGVILQ